MEADPIAPCGMYRAVCSGYLAYLNQTPASGERYRIARA